MKSSDELMEMALNHIDPRSGMPGVHANDNMALAVMYAGTRIAEAIEGLDVTAHENLAQIAAELGGFGLALDRISSTMEKGRTGL